MAISRAVRMGAVIGALLALTACQDGETFSFLKKKDGAAQDAAGSKRKSTSVRLVERDVEAPEAFQVTESALWDGRPSLGGVWVAHPDVKDPERVIIRNQSNNKFVIGALFRRERENPGPRLQASSDAASALGMLAGQPAQLNVTALRREEVGSEDTAAPKTSGLTAPETVETATLDDPISSAAAALDKVDAQTVAAPQAPRPARAAPATGLSKPFIQIGIFSVEQNARNTAISLRQIGLSPDVIKQSSKGKAFWRVVVGPANSSADRASMLKKVKGIGFADAYFVTN